MDNHYCMHMELYPSDFFDTDIPYVDVRAVPADSCSLDRATDLFFSLFAARVKSTERQALDIQIVTDGQSPDDVHPSIVRAVARLGGCARISAWLYEADAGSLMPKHIGTVPGDTDTFRKLDTIDTVSCWDVIHHGEAYPSPRAEYDRKVEGFLKGEYVNEIRGNETVL